jgi:hypothetical protein
MMIFIPAPRAEVMRIFDELPPRVREAMAFADFPYDPRDISQRIERGIRPSVVARSIEKRRTI